VSDAAGDPDFYREYYAASTLTAGIFYILETSNRRARVSKRSAFRPGAVRLPFE